VSLRELICRLFGCSARRPRYVIRFTLPDGTYFQGVDLVTNLARGATATLSIQNAVAADGGPGDPPADVVFSADPAVATIAGDQLTALAGGETKVSASGTGFTANAADLVVSNPPAVSGDVVVTAN
jgi:hypothetical protein